MALRQTHSVKVEGLRELEKSLAELPRATARGVLHRVLRKAGEPTAAMARSLAPDDPATGPPDLHRSIFVSTRVKNNVGKAEFAAAMRSGAGKAAAVAAMRTARRDAKGQGSFAEVYVGVGEKQFHGSLQEFGTSHHPPQPFMRPAWDANKGRALEIIKSELGGEILKTAARLAKRQARKAAKA